MREKRIRELQNSMVEQHLREIENIYTQMRGWRHDYHNHIQVLKSCLSQGKYDEAAAYLTRLDSDLTDIDTVIKSGNLMADAILNSKISLAKARKIEVSAKASVPKNITVSDIDLCVILGNLLDNAAEACVKIPDASNRRIRVYLGVLKEYLYISVSNTMSEPPKKGARGYLSLKGEHHGLGLTRVDRLAEKYGGYVNRQFEEGYFATEVMLPL